MVESMWRPRDRKAAAQQAAAVRALATVLRAFRARGSSPEARSDASECAKAKRANEAGGPIRVLRLGCFVCVWPLVPSEGGQRAGGGVRGRSIAHVNNRYRTRRKGVVFKSVRGALIGCAAAFAPAPPSLNELNINRRRRARRPPIDREASLLAGICSWLLRRPAAPRPGPFQSNRSCAQGPAPFRPTRRPLA